MFMGTFCGAYGVGFLRGLCRDTYAPARFGDSLLLSVPLQTDARGAHLYQEVAFLRRTSESMAFWETQCIDFLASAPARTNQLNLNPKAHILHRCHRAFPRWYRPMNPTQ
jgi:hypothetical protein